MSVRCYFRNEGHIPSVVRNMANSPPLSVYSGNVSEGHLTQGLTLFPEWPISNDWIVCEHLVQYFHPNSGYIWGIIPCSGRPKRVSWDFWWDCSESDFSFCQSFFLHCPSLQQVFIFQALPNGLLSPRICFLRNSAYNTVALRQWLRPESSSRLIVWWLTHKAGIWWYQIGLSVGMSTYSLSMWPGLLSAW